MVLIGPEKVSVVVISWLSGYRKAELECIKILTSFTLYAIFNN